MTTHVLDQGIDLSKNSTVSLKPVLIIFPAVFVKKKPSRRRLTLRLKKIMLGRGPMLHVTDAPQQPLRVAWTAQEMHGFLPSGEFLF